MLIPTVIASSPVVGCAMRSPAADFARHVPVSGESIERKRFSGMRAISGARLPVLCVCAGCRRESGASDSRSRPRSRNTTAPPPMPGLAAISEPADLLVRAEIAASFCEP
jgi:hypothetical protein